MARQDRKAKKAKRQQLRQRQKEQIQDFPISFGKKNYIIFGIGILIIIIGYVLLGSSRDGILAMYLSPILLVGGYCVILPISILYRRAEPLEVQGE